MGKLNSYQQENIFSGSISKSRELQLQIRYFIKPDKENHQLAAYRWSSDLCFDKAQDKEKQRFALSQTGIDEIRAWLVEQYELI